MYHDSKITLWYYADIHTLPFKSLTGSIYSYMKLKTSLQRWRWRLFQIKSFHQYFVELLDSLFASTSFLVCSKSSLWVSNSLLAMKPKIAISMLGKGEPTSPGIRLDSVSPTNMIIRSKVQPKKYKLFFDHAGNSILTKLICRSLR